MDYLGGWDTEAELILSTPLSLQRTVDRVIWHLDKKGMFC
jgi:hypothetical protein